MSVVAVRVVPMMRFVTVVMVAMVVLIVIDVNFPW